MTSINLSFGGLDVDAVAAARARVRPVSPAQLARRLDPKFRITPAIALLDLIAVRAATQPGQRDIVNTSPRTGKSQELAVWLPVWALRERHDLQIIMTAHTDDLAQEFSRKARQIIRDNSEYLGYRISPEKTAAGRWSIQIQVGQTWENRSGGVLATGIHSGITGMGADLLIIDDPVKSMEEADSKAHRRKVLSAYQSVLEPRVHPGGSVLIVHTRWHEQDLAGSLLSTQPARWKHTNIPAVAENGVFDSLRRPVGVSMTSALGFTADDYADLQASLGGRVWYALYQGLPKPLDGGIIKQAWLDEHRLPAAPEGLVRIVVGVDPADSGEGDDCGVVAWGATRDGVRVMIADVSAQMTSDQWSVAAVSLAVQVGASEIAVEGFAARVTYTRLVREALDRAGVERPIAVTSWPPKGSGRGSGDSLARVAGLRQALETGQARLAGHFPTWEAKATGWQEGQHQPDSLAASVVADDVLVSSMSGGMQLSGVPGVDSQSPDEWARPISDDWLWDQVGYAFPPL